MANTQTAVACPLAFLVVLAVAEQACIDLSGDWTTSGDVQWTATLSQSSCSGTGTFTGDTGPVGHTFDYTVSGNEFSTSYTSPGFTATVTQTDSTTSFELSPGVTMTRNDGAATWEKLHETEAWVPQYSKCQDIATTNHEEKHVSNHAGCEEAAVSNGSPFYSWSPSVQRCFLYQTCGEVRETVNNHEIYWSKAACDVVDGSDQSSSYPCVCGALTCSKDQKCTASSSLNQCEGVHPADQWLQYADGYAICEEYERRFETPSWDTCQQDAVAAGHRYYMWRSDKKKCSTHSICTPKAYARGWKIFVQSDDNHLEEVKQSGRNLRSDAIVV